MGQFVLLLLALVASAIVCVQNLPAVTGFTWALIHGAGILSAIGFIPAALALAVVWAGYFSIKRKVVNHTTPLFAAFAVVVLVVNEWLLPVTPLKQWRTRGALEGVRVVDVRDELLLSARGNPIGVRISFDATVPRPGAYMISVSTLTSASGDIMWPLQFGQSYSHQIHPPPTKQRDSVYDIFEPGVVYTFSQDMLPNFIGYDERTKTPCFTEVRTKYITDADFRAALAANRNIGLRTVILAQGEYNPASVVAAMGVTSRQYDMEAIYDTIAKEGGGRCGP